MAISSLEYQNHGWDVKLPSIRAYTFHAEDIDRFIEKGQVPLDFDTNLVGGCNADCKYCATEGGKSDVRFSNFNGHQKLSDDNLSQMIKQLNELGTRTFFICSNGEPLLNPGRFLDILDNAGDTDLNIVTYTNATTLQNDFLKELHNRRVNLVMKLESFNPELNDRIIFGKQNKSYEYAEFNGKTVPTGIIEAFQVYGSDSDCLGIETMILRDNIEEVLKIREWAYDLGSSQFLKHLYPLGYAKFRGEEVLPDSGREHELVQQIIDFDESYGFVYPDFLTPDHFSYDARRFMNNCVSSGQFPFRMFAHEAGGVYHSSQVVPEKFGFGTNLVIPVLDFDGGVDMKKYLEKIGECLNG